MREQREQVLFLVTLVLVAWLTYSRASDRHVRVNPRPAGQLATLEIAQPPRVRLDASAADADGARRDRSLFAPPRELLPLDPLALPAPPVPSLPVRRPATSPAPRGVFARADRVATEDLGDLRPEGSGEDVGSPGEDVTGVGGGIGMGGGRTTAAPPPDASGETVPPEQRYDSITQVNLGRIFGRILNDAPHKLASRPTEPIRFQQVSVTSGRDVGVPIDVPRTDLEAWALAKTFENDALLKSGALGSGPGAAASRKALALEFLSKWPSEPMALALAEAEAERAHAASGRDPSTARLLAGIRRRAGDLEGELAVYEEAEEQDYADAALLTDHGAFARSLGLHERALERLAAAEQRAGSSAEVRALRGRLLLDEGRFAEALAAFQAIPQPASFSEPFVAEQRHTLAVDMGTAMLALGRPQDAEQRARGVLLDAPTHREALSLLVASLAAKGDLVVAREAAGQLLAAAPEHGPSLTNAALVAWAAGDGESAWSLARRARDVDPYHAVAPTLVLGFLHEDAGERGAAQDAYAEALRMDPNHVEALYRMGRVQRLDGDAEGATSTLREALKLSAPDALLLGELALAALDRGLPQAAARYCREALRLEPDNGRIAWLLGLAMLHEGDVSGAVDELQRAATAGEAGAHSALGVAYYRRGDAPASLEQFDAVAREFAGDAEHPIARYAAQQAAAIRDNLAKRQWVDRFVRANLQRGWEERVWEGSPRVELRGDGLRIMGRMERTGREGERPGVTRPVEGEGFFSAEAVFSAGPDHDGRYGLTLVHRQAKGTLGRLPKAQLDIWVTEDGVVRTSVLDGFDNLVVDGAPLAGITIPKGESVALGIERLDLVGGEFQFLVDGRRTGQPVVVKALRNFAKNVFDLEVYAEAAPGRSVDASVTLVRIVQAP